jgi:hypothetical protein
MRCKQYLEGSTMADADGPSAWNHFSEVFHDIIARAIRNFAHSMAPKTATIFG